MAGSGKRVVVAKSAGFCFGVQRAVDQVLRIAEREEAKPPSERKPIYTYGAIVHNDTVVTALKERGVSVLETREELEALSGGIVIIRAHGVPREIYELLRERGIETVDASCPYVRKIQRLAEEHTGRGEKCFIVGDPHHPEIIGIMGWARGEITALPGPEEAEKLPDGEGERVLVLAQTTFNVDKFKLLIDILEKKRYHTNVINTICNATFERQEEAKKLAGSSDAMIVIGGSSSSNTKKLFEICQSECRNTQLIQTVKDLKLYSDEAIRNVAITAGASTPKEIIKEVLTYVRNEF